MKNLLSISLLLIFQVSFSQIEKTENKLTFENAANQSQIFMNEQSSKIFPKTNEFKIEEIKNNSEDKFSLNDTNNIFFTKNINLPTSTIYVTNSLKNEDNVASRNFTTTAKKEFVNKIIKKKIQDEIKRYIAINEALSYGDRNVDLYKNYADLENKLIVSYPINTDIELQIGKDIYPYLNKILKTELDKTLQNSLNLFVINF